MQMNYLKLTPGQSAKERRYLEYIQRKNAERERLPRGVYAEKSI